jgi:hypothetical protein
MWTRLEPFHSDQLARLILDRRTVRVALMRNTVHLVSARDCLALRPLVQPVIDRGLYANRAGVEGMDIEALRRSPPPAARCSRRGDVTIGRRRSSDQSGA